MRSFRYNILPVFVLLAVMLAVFPSYSSAARISVGSATAVAGGTVQIPVTLSGITTSVGGVQFAISYDSNLLTLSGITLGPAAVGLSPFENKTVPGEYTAMFLNYNLSAAVIPNGLLVSLFFNVAAGTGTQQTSPALTRGSIANIYGSSLIAGDCDDNGITSIAEVQSAINMFLGLQTSYACVDLSANGSVSISEVQKTINSFLGL